MVEDISSDEEDLPKKRCRAPEVLPTEDPEVLICEPDVVLPAKDLDIIYLGSFKSTKKTSPKAPPNSPTYPSLSVPQSSNIWLEGTSVYPVQVMF